MASYPSHLKHEHTPLAIRERLHRMHHESNLSAAVYGAIDGTVTTFAVVSGVAGAGLGSSVILILGIANLVADGFSMAAGNYSSVKTANAERALIRQYENEQVERDPAGEIEEIRQIYIAKGFSGQLLDEAVKLTISDRSRWISMMLSEEYGLSKSAQNPLRSALATFTAFIVAGSIPLISFVFNLREPFLISTVLTGISFFLIGSLKSRWTIENFVVAGFKTFVIGSVAAAVAYYVGVILKSLS